MEQVLPAGVQRRLTDAEHDAYREPFRVPGEGRRAVLLVGWLAELT